MVTSKFKHWPELLSKHFEHWTEQEVFSVIADNGTGGILIYGAGVEDWQHIDFTHVEVNLTVNGQVIRVGVAEKMLGDPMEHLVWLANVRSRDGEGLKQGHIHNTGTVTDIIRVNAGDEAIATFSEIGSVVLTIK